MITWHTITEEYETRITTQHFTNGQNIIHFLILASSFLGYSLWPIIAEVWLPVLSGRSTSQFPRVPESGRTVIVRVPQSGEKLSYCDQQTTRQMFGNGRNQLALTLFARAGADPFHETRAVAKGRDTLACRDFVIDPGLVRTGMISTAWLVRRQARIVCQVPFRRLLEGFDFIPQVPDDCDASFPISLGSSLHL